MDDRYHSSPRDGAHVRLIHSPALARQAPATASVAVADSPGWLKCTKDAVSTVQSVATIVALLAGAWWVLRRRRTCPRANFRHIVSHVPLNDDTYLVRLTVSVENVGDVLLQLEESLVGIQQVMPLREHLQSALSAGDKNPEIKWPFIDTRRQNRSGSEIESGESAAFEFELFAPRTIRFVIVYSYFQKRHEAGSSGLEYVDSLRPQNTQT
jgi:hypothetical protein